MVRALAFALIAWLPLLATSAASGQALARPSYALDVRLDADAGVLHGHALIRFPNRSPVALDALYFHLYPNAFANEQTLFMREQGTALRGTQLERPGGIELSALERVEGEQRESLLASADFELVAGDRTQLRVPLARPLAPGALLQLSVTFTVRLPSIVARMGRAGNFFMIAQWYPKLARLEPDGRWASHAYHGLGEFDADFADHELTIEAPRELTIAAPGDRLEQRIDAAGRRHERYRLNDALDIAFAAYPDFVVAREQANGIALEVFAPRGHLALARSQLRLLQHGLSYLGRRLGPYPHRRLVLVLPPRAAFGAEGMEYPGLVVGATAGFHSELSFAGIALHDLTTTHELAHQWFPMLVASDEPERPMLDEGLAQWLGMDLLRERYGPRSPLARWLGAPFDPFSVLRALFVRGEPPPSSLLPAASYRPRELGAAVYARPALALEQLRRQHGEGKLWRALGRYAREQRGRHPRLQELLAAIDREYGAGFSASRLRPWLAGETAPALLARGDSETIEPIEAAPTEPRPHAWFPRWLSWAQLLLGAIGP